MTATNTAPEALPTETPASNWNGRLAELQRRYPKVREPILAALQVLAQDPDVALHDAKALAVANGVRITAASVAAAKRLLQRQTPPAVDGVADAPKRSAATTKPTAVAPRRARTARPARAATPALDVEALVRTIVEKIRRSRARPTPRPSGCEMRCGGRSPCCRPPSRRDRDGPSDRDP